MADNKSEMNTKLVRELAELLVEMDLSEIEIKDSGQRIRLARGGVVAPAPQPAAIAQPQQATSQAPAAPAETAEPSGNEVPSPMVGTIYLAPSPGADPYVEIGSRVKEGDTLLIIEAMKTMNHIPAPRAGIVSAILVEDKQPVEYGEPLVVLE